MNETILEGRGQWRGDRVGLAIGKLKQSPKYTVTLEAARSEIIPVSGVVAVRYPIGCVVHATAVARDARSPDGQVFNVDALVGGVDENGEQYYWGIRETIQGSNSFLHEPEWIGLQSPQGTACSSWGPCKPNSIFTWVRGASIQELLERGPNGYRDSRT